jgi:hypothetical protein
VVLHVGQMHDCGDHQAEGVGHDVTLVAFDQFPASKPHWVPIMPTERPAPHVQFARRHHQQGVDHMPKAGVSPVIEITLQPRTVGNHAQAGATGSR